MKICELAHDFQSQLDARDNRVAIHDLDTKLSEWGWRGSYDYECRREPHFVYRHSYPKTVVIYFDLDDLKARYYHIGNTIQIRTTLPQTWWCKAKEVWATIKDPRDLIELGVC